MKKILLLISLIFIVSCDYDEKYEDDNKYDDIEKYKKEDDIFGDSDDINAIDKVGEQALDKAIDTYDTKTSAS